MASGRTKVTATWDKTSTQQTGTGQGYATTMVVAICFGAMCAPLSGFHLRISPSLSIIAMKAIFLQLSGSTMYGTRSARN
jgi:hypothetical protein